jgi:stage II sporulation protein D
VFCLAVTGPGASTASEQSAPPKSILQVGLWTLWHDREIVISPVAGKSSTMKFCPQCAAEPLPHALHIHAAGNSVQADGAASGSVLIVDGAVQLTAHGETLLSRHPLRIASHESILMLSVSLPVETYVERVVASESSADDSDESLRALAIVVRSYALHQPHGHAEYDLCDSTHCQFLHWGGVRERMPAAHAATLATAGETLWHSGIRAAAWFHQNCGGRTAAPDEVWPAAGSARPGARTAWLVSRADQYCVESGARQWATTLSLADLTAALAAQGLARPGWRNLTVERRGESGRAVTLRADQTQVSAEDFRLAVGRALGWNRVLSTWFEIGRQGDQFYFHGRGSGHGVGLCQAGAAAMARHGMDHRQILAQYFAGAVAADERTGIQWKTFSSDRLRLETLDDGDAAYLNDVQRALAEAVSLSGLHPEAPLVMRTFRSTEAFRAATLAPGWVAAFTEGNWIGAQPLRTLAARHALDQVLRHEMLHALIEGHASARAPLWLREGLAETWSGGAPAGPAAPAMPLKQIDELLAHAASGGQSEAAHRTAGWYAARLLNRYGRAQVLDWLRTGTAIPPP